MTHRKVPCPALAKPRAYLGVEPKQNATPGRVQGPEPFNREKVMADFDDCVYCGKVVGERGSDGWHSWGGGGKYRFCSADCSKKFWQADEEASRAIETIAWVDFNYPGVVYIGPRFEMGRMDYEGACCNELSSRWDTFICDEREGIWEIWEYDASEMTWKRSAEQHHGPLPRFE